MSELCLGKICWTHRALKSPPDMLLSNKYLWQNFNMQSIKGAGGKLHVNLFILWITGFITYALILLIISAWILKSLRSSAPDLLLQLESRTAPQKGIKKIKGLSSALNLAWNAVRLRLVKISLKLCSKSEICTTCWGFFHLLKRASVRVVRNDCSTADPPH